MKLSNVQGSNSLDRAAVLLLIFITAVAAQAARAQTQIQTDDPWRTTNERIFRFNDYLDRHVATPIANTYTLVVPRVARQGIGNFFSNINDINVFANDLLQLKFEAALSDSGRFLINSTIGLGGILDVASSMGLEKNEEDFGQTLGHWGIGSGPYVVLPLFGPSNVRDSFGLVLDTLFNPIQYQDDDSVRWGLYTMDQVHSRASVLALDELVSGDRYLFLREAYLERREYLVEDGQTDDGFGEF